MIRAVSESYKNSHMILDLNFPNIDNFWQELKIQIAHF